MQIKTSTQYQLPYRRVAKIKKTDNNKHQQECGERQRYQVELHQVPDFEGRRDHQALCSHHRAKGF